MDHISKTWPTNADGDVFRKLESQGFDFSKIYSIDFNIDFEHWPPHEDILTRLKHEFPGITVHADEEAGDGYILIKIDAQLTYEFVTKTQARVTDIVCANGGICESWGILH